jgi:ribosomal protein L29
MAKLRTHELRVKNKKDLLKQVDELKSELQTVRRRARGALSSHHRKRGRERARAQRCSAACRHAATRGAVSRAPVRWYPGAVRTGGDAERRSAARCVRALGGDCCRGRPALSRHCYWLLSRLPDPWPRLLPHVSLRGGLDRCRARRDGRCGRSRAWRDPLCGRLQAGQFHRALSALRCAAPLESSSSSSALLSGSTGLCCSSRCDGLWGRFPPALCPPPSPPLPPVPPTSSHRTPPSPSPHPLLPPFSCAWPR